MPKYILTIFLLCITNTAYAEILDNEKALNIIYNTKISGIGLNSSTEDVNHALSQHKIPMDCNYREHTATSRSRINKGKEQFYQDWRCKYTEGMKYKMLDVHAVNGAIYLIMYRGSILSSLDAKDMFSYYRDINEKLLATGIVHDDYNFTFHDMGPDISPQRIEQSLTTRLQAQCKGMPSTVSFKEKLTEMPAQKAFTIEVKYERQRCL